MQIDLQEIALPPASFQFAVTVLALWLPEKLLWKAADSHCQIVVVISTSVPLLSFPPILTRLQSLLLSYNSALSRRVTMSASLLSSIYLVPSVLYLMEINPHS